MRILSVACALCFSAGLAVAQVPAPTPAPAPAPSGPAPVVPKEMSPPDSWVPKGTAELVVLDKLRAQPVSLTIKTGQSATYGSLTILVKSCDARPPDLPQNSTVFVEITDSRGSAPVFDGWLFSNTPSVSQFEHPVYDLRLVRCS
jgi:hypothetical protein